MEKSILDENFTLNELNDAIKSSRISAPGYDNISYEIFKNMSQQSLQHILLLYNQIWQEGIVPNTWKQAIIIPIIKQGKNKHLPLSYRPISLTPTISKIMEKMIIVRLKSLNNKQKTVTLFLDIEKAYDMLWKEGLLYKLFHLGIRGKMFNWIQSFLKID